MGKPKQNINQMSKPRLANSYLSRVREMPYGNSLVENVSLSFAYVSIHHVEDARQSERRERICYLQFKTQGKFENSPAFVELWRFWEEEAEAEIDDMWCATGYTLKTIIRREPDWNDDAGAGGAALNVSA